MTNINNNDNYDNNNSRESWETEMLSFGTALQCRCTAW